jgi:hypothetical protein
MVSGSSVAPTGRSLEDDRGVDVAPAGRGGDVEGAVAIEPERSQLQLPAPGEQRESRQQNWRGGAFARADGQRKLRRARRLARL